MLENFRRAFSPDPTDCPWVSDSEDAVSVKSVEDVSACGRRSSSSHASEGTSGTLGLGTILFTFVETLVTLRPLRR